jgi:site-specific recombinase XerD
MVMGGYSTKSIQSYLRELRFIAEYYPELPLHDLTAEAITQYMFYLNKTLGCGRDKCRMAASALGFYFKNILRKPYELPSKLYPKQQFKLPVIMTTDEVQQLFDSALSLKQRAICELLYSTGVRLEECTNLKVADIDSKRMCIHLKQGKGNRDRKLLLSPRCLTTLRDYYREHRPKVYIFEGTTPAKKMHNRSLGHAVTMSLKAGGLDGKGYSAHSFRHSFATHMLDAGVDLHTIKELLGHSKIETTMVYLHLQTKKRLALISPLDALYTRNDLGMAVLSTPVL